MVLKGKEFPQVFATKGIESHLTWIQCNIPNIELTAMRDLKTMEEYVLTLIEAEKHTQNTDALVAKEGRATAQEPEAEAGNAPEVGVDGEDETDEQCHGSVIGYFALKLNIAAMHAFVSDFEVAEGNLAEARKLLKELASGHQDVASYCVEALQYSIAILKNQDGEVEVDDSEFVAAVQRIQIKDKTTLAVITFLKGCLAVGLKVPDEEVLMMFESAAKLDPDCYLWHHYVFRKLRRIRRCQRFQSSFPEEPCPKEEHYCRTAYDLRAEDEFITIVDYALLLKEGLWGKRGEVWDDQMDKVILCVKLFKDALGRAKEKKNEWWIRKIKIYFAEYLVFGKSQWLDAQEGKKLLEECMEDYPSNSTVFHKAGKFYCHGLQGSHLYKDPTRGKACLEKGLECCPRNFPCLMDYIKLLKDLRKMTEAVRTIDKHLNLMVRDHQVGKLQIMRGCIVWQFDPFENIYYKKEASDSWLLVLEKYPALEEELFGSVRRLYCRPYDVGDHKNRKYAYSDRVRLLEHLESRKPEFVGDGTKAMKLQALIDALNTVEKKDSEIDWSTVRCPRDDQESVNEEVFSRFRHLAVSSRASSASNASFYTAYSQPQRWMRNRNANFNDNNNVYKPGEGSRIYQVYPQLTKKSQQWNSVADEDGDWRRKN